MAEVKLALENPLTDDPDLELLFQRHTQAMHADTPPESIHMMPREALLDPAIDFFVLRDDGRAIGMAAIKRIAPRHGEIKSMHVLSEERGRGLAILLLEGLLTHSRQAGLSRISLETGSQDSFGAARRLYEGAGFRECPPFADYRLDPMSVYLTLPLVA